MCRISSIAPSARSIGCGDDRRFSRLNETPAGFGPLPGLREILERSSEYSLPIWTALLSDRHDPGRTQSSSPGVDRDGYPDCMLN